MPALFTQCLIFLSAFYPLRFTPLYPHPRIPRTPYISAVIVSVNARTRLKQRQVIFYTQKKGKKKTEGKFFRFDKFAMKYLSVAVASIIPVVQLKFIGRYSNCSNRHKYHKKQWS